jgi:ankyrin repeat protein
MPAAVYAAAPGVSREVIEIAARRGTLDIFTALALGDEATAARLLAEDRSIIAPGGTSDGALHLLAKRGDVKAVKWLLEHDADPNARWSHWSALVTPLHLAALHGHADVVRLLLDAGADPGIRDSMHDSNVLGWAEYVGNQEIVRILEAHAAGS